MYIMRPPVWQIGIRHDHYPEVNYKSAHFKSAVIINVYFYFIVFARGDFIWIKAVIN